MNNEAKANDESTREHIYRALKEDIIYLRLVPGAMISENDCAKRFSVSRTPIRDAISRLQIDNLVEVRPQRGTFVSLIDLDYVEDIIYMRHAVETNIFTELIDVITDLQLEVLLQNIEEQKHIIKAISEGASEVEFFNVDSQFHKYAYSYVNRTKLWEIIQQLKVHYTRFRMLDLVKTKDFKTLLKEHCSIVDMIQKKDKKAIRDIMTEHLYGGINRLSDKIKNDYRDYFVK